MINSIKARDLLTLDPVYILDNFPSKINLIYDNGEIVESSIRKLVYSWYIWEFHRQYPMLELNFEHHVDSVLNGKLLSSSTHIRLLNKITKQLILLHSYNSHEEKENILSLLYYVTNQLANELPKLAERYVATIDILDILEITNDEEISNFRNNTEATAISIADFYANSRKIILDNPKYKNNNMVQFIRMEILNINQINQCILARGFPTEVTGTILKTPIMSNYVTGMHLLYDYVAESRGAAKHLYSAKAPLQDTEYFARRLQLTSMVVSGIAPGDCGTKKTLPWFVKGPTMVGGRQIYAGDLNYMKGKFYVNDNNELKHISGNETELVGKLINLRSSIFCIEPNPHLICEKCFGMLSHNISRFANVGHLCAATLTHKLTQMILGTKHLIGSAVGTEFQLKEDARRYVRFDFNASSFFLKPFNTKSKYKLIINRKMAIGLTDIKLVNNIEHIMPYRISSIENIIIQEFMENGAMADVIIKITQNKQHGYFTKEFLRFIQSTGWITNERDHFVFDLTNWNNKLPFIRIPDIEYSYSDHADRIADIIESNTDKLYSRSKEEAPVQMLTELFDLVNSKIDVNLALLEVLIYAVMTPSVTDYGMARNKPGSGLHVARFITYNRSLGPAYAYQNQFKTISNPRSFFIENRPDSPIDVLLAPREVVRALKDNGKHLEIYNKK